MHYFNKYADMIPQEMYEAMANESEVCVRKFVAEHVKIPAILLQLSTDSSPEVQSAVAKNPNTPAKVLLKLSNSQHKSVLLTLSKNPNIPKKALLNIISALVDNKLLTP